MRIASKHWREANLSEVEKLENLERDCLNAPYHYFGCHDNCLQYFCNKSTTPKSGEVIGLLKAEGLFDDVLNLCNIFSDQMPRAF